MSQPVYFESPFSACILEGALIIAFGGRRMASWNPEMTQLREATSSNAQRRSAGFRDVDEGVAN
jgi:hypothetical protein